MHPHLAPLVFGTLVILGLAFYLFLRHPSPGMLSNAHRTVEHLTKLHGCIDCHTSEGIASGCLNCHSEIKEQLSNKIGYHAYILGDNVTCTKCHSEHNGPLFDLMGKLAWEEKDPNKFSHPHVDFCLIEAHNVLSCDECHDQKGKITFTLDQFPDIPRKSTFLGLEQKCISCHEDVHAGGLASDCTECHGQLQFRPATFFDHSEFIPLVNGHSGIECKLCHTLPELTEKNENKFLPFDQVRGTRCEECHDSPHRVIWEQECELCHPEDAPPWSEGKESVTKELHELVGFRLDVPHDKLECDQCHDPNLSFENRYPDPTSAGYLRREESCEGCHQDIHGGQFLPFHTQCMDCHEKTHFLPPDFGVEEHEELYPLLGVHKTTDCQDCHKLGELNSDLGKSDAIRMFRGISQECLACHEDVHLGQFLAEGIQLVQCQHCHPLPTSWTEIDFEHNLDSRYMLEFSHLSVDCEKCHQLDSFPQGDSAIRYRPLGMRCEDCHEDIHRGQFIRNDSVQCEHCHPLPTAWDELGFVHNQDSRFALAGVHAETDCVKCHKPETQPDNVLMTRYRPMGMRCEDCHEDIHFGQFREGGLVNCDTCHPFPSSWHDLDFDHNTDSQFPLDGTHATVSCEKCHPEVSLRSGANNCAIQTLRYSLRRLSWLY